MANFRKIFLLTLLFSLTVGGYSFSNEPLTGTPVTTTLGEEETKPNTMLLTITINTLSSVKMKNVPLKGYLEVYSILGKREKRIKLDNCEGEISIDLPKGLYILKAEKVTQKIRIQ